jgi:hypothetical protein
MSDRDNIDYAAIRSESRIIRVRDIAVRTLTTEARHYETKPGAAGDILTIVAECWGDPDAMQTALNEWAQYNAEEQG